MTQSVLYTYIETKCMTKIAQRLGGGKRKYAVWDDTV